MVERLPRGIRSFDRQEEDKDDQQGIDDLRGIFEFPVIKQEEWQVEERCIDQVGCPRNAREKVNEDEKHGDTCEAKAFLCPFSLPDHYNDKKR